MTFPTRKWNKFLLGEAEQADVDRFLDRLSRVDPSEAPFDNIFKGKWRMVIPYAPKEYEYLKQIWHGTPDDYNIFYRDQDPGWPDEPYGWMGKKGKDKESYDKRSDKLKGEYLASIRAVVAEIDPADAAGKKWGAANSTLTMRWEKENPDHPLSQAIRQASGQYFSHKKRGPREIKLGKIINREFKDRPELVKTWNDEAASWNKDAGAFSIARNIGNYSMILSRHPIDVYRMSDHMGITSCHSLEAGQGYCAAQEAEDFGMIAYVVETKDFEALDLDEDEIFFDQERPGATRGLVELIERKRLRRYFNKKDNYDLAIPDIPEYGLKRMPGFFRFLSKWAREQQKEQVYGDDKRINKPKITDFVRMGGSYADSPDKDLFNEFFKTNDYAGKPSYKDEEGNIIDPSPWSGATEEEWKSAVADIMADFRKSVTEKHLWRPEKTSPGVWLNLDYTPGDWDPYFTGEFQYIGKLFIYISRDALTEEGEQRLKGVLADLVLPSSSEEGIIDKVEDIFQNNMWPPLRTDAVFFPVSSKGSTYNIEISIGHRYLRPGQKTPDTMKRFAQQLAEQLPSMIESAEKMIDYFQESGIMKNGEEEEKPEKEEPETLQEIEPFQRKVAAKHKRMKIRLIGKGKGSHTAGSYKKKPNYKRSKSAPPVGEKLNK